ncbi:PEP-CTERM sorting domain-containing protein [Botrimarina hoheduenensis]|uniref:Ice-binding protein C-terminal domain-containing protein n=1 Tax=Botrimarina hoheduenensis TaxID=2528000 RepID=A0A5C5WBR9_9BACT|nr:PEP-CTERM sorting domain-containing protein [Botrimarina hoheduenensis]TWT47545.1 hypothetical protein Pla111_11600 [Botrimarina hoheduenensis]
MKRFGLMLALVASACVAQRAAAVELLTNGNFEAALVETIDGWNLAEYRTADPNIAVNSAAIVGFANNPGGTAGEFGLWLRSFVGNPTDGLADAVLTQTVAAAAGETYTFSGEASFEQNHAAGVPFLDLLSPFGEVASPTQATFRLEFLGAGGAVLGSASQNVADDVFNGFGYSAVTPIVAVAPAGTVSARVVAEETGMAINIDPGQSAFYDNFSLKAASNPTSELLTNGNLNTPITQSVVGFEFVEAPSGTDTLALAGFANDPATGGAQGVWIRGFVAGDGTVKTSVPATPGAEYSFKASTRWEANYTGGLPETGTETMLELAFLDSSDSVLGSPVTLDLRTVQMNDGEWRNHELLGTAPAGAVSVRVSGIVTGLQVGTGGGLSAFFDDFSLMTTAVALNPGDFNGDGKVDNGDLNLLLGNWGANTVPGAWINGFAAPVDNAELNALLGNWGFGVGVAVPEPASLLLMAAAGLVSVRRRR